MKFKHLELEQISYYWRWEARVYVLAVLDGPLHLFGNLDVLGEGRESIRFLEKFHMVDLDEFWVVFGK